MKFFKEIKLSGEGKYYLRDLYIFLLSIFISILLAETIIFSDSNAIDLVDKIFVYIYIIFPLFSLALIISYIYRNIRIRQTGKLRSVIRYRLTLAFVFVSILPSIPIVLFSSNVVGRLVESFYRIDISEALKSAIADVKQAEEEDKKNVIAKAKLLQRAVTKGFAQPENIYTRTSELGLLQSDKYYVGIIKGGKVIAETLPLYSIILLQNFTKKTDEPYENYTLYQKDKSYILVKITSKEADNFVILGRRMHIGNEKNTFNVIYTENSYNSADLWKEKVPFALRFSLGVFFIMMFGISIIVSFLLARQISRPIVQLASATQRVSRGEIDVQLDLNEEGEMGILIESFNQLTRDLKAKNEELLHTQRIAAWKEVAQRMAHEIKNPLTPIQLSAERIRKRLDNPNREKFDEVVRNGTETIIGQVRVLEHLVKEFSEFARMPTPILINQQLNPIVEESVKLFIDSININFVLKLSKNLPEVFIDKRLFLGVVNNLIKNAVEAIQNHRKESSDTNESQDEILGTIRISTKLEKKLLRKSVVLTVEDSGPGISPELKEKIFQPYYSTKGGHGTGIGLAIVEKTVYDHHAHLSLDESTLGGCNFKIEIPLEDK
ncbi:MAG: HAMP domain-containing protein [Leptospiraceae bacterium]|jgi:two-component system nitrogen regulation sensor histidine kinase NtrY|nr:HAMP domain-containing protein [Leptospiraceae bacterium]